MLIKKSVYIKSVKNLESFKRKMRKWNTIGSLISNMFTVLKSFNKSLRNKSFSYPHLGVNSLFKDFY